MNLSNLCLVRRISVHAVLLACILPLPVAAAEHQASVATSGEPASSSPQASDSASQTATGPNLRQNPNDVLRKFEPSADEEYTLGAGDEILVQFPGHTELSGRDIIGPDGRITLMVAGPIEVANLTREAAAKKIEDALSSYYTNLSATVQVERYGSNHINLLGDVKNPGVLSFDQTPTLLEALSRGGIQNRPDGTVPDKCVIYRGDQVVWIDLQGLLATGSPLANVRLRRNDLVFVPAISDKTISVMGQVQHPGEIVLKRTSTLASVLSDAGGLADAAGNNPEIQIVHRSKAGQTQYVRFKALLKPEGGLEISLNPGDVIYIPKSGLAKVGFVMQQLGPLGTIGSFATIAAR